MRSDKDILAGFYSDQASLHKTLSLTNSDYHARAADFIKTLKNFGIEENHVTLDDFAIFSHKGLTASIEKFIKSNPLDALPLEQITIAQYACAETYNDDFARILTSLQEQSEQMAHVSTHYNIDLTLNIFLQGMDPESASSIAEFAQSRTLDSLGFLFDFESITTESASDLKTALRDFLETPALTNPKIYFGNFPFCLFPAHKFKFLYRDAVEPLKGFIGSQRAWIKELHDSPATYHNTCESCRCRIPCYALTEIGECEAPSFVTPRQKKTLAFAGGSLAPDDRPNDDNIVWTTPAEQGDMATAVLEGFDNILIIDGYFYSKFPCTTFEVMLILEHSINVFGSSSIGALRAVELDQYGMIGLGEVYDRLRREEIKPYHIVAQTYDENDSALTIPLVQILYFLDQALSDNLLSPDQHRAALKTAEEIHFTLLSFNYLFRQLRVNEIALSPDIDALEQYYSDKGPAAFDVKRKDALHLLDQYRAILDSRPANFVEQSFAKKRDETIDTLQRKYGNDRNLSLPTGWAKEADLSRDNVNLRDNRVCNAAETCEHARAFFEDMDILVADTTLYDEANSFILSTFFIPFYFLAYYPSSATGNGDVFDEALASAYMELVERIPSSYLMNENGNHNTTSTQLFPTAQIPQYYNWGTDPSIKQQAIDKHGLIQVTDIVSGSEFIIPAFSIMFYYSGTDGNASGNTIQEAILYGLYELVERDTCQIHVSDPGCRQHLANLMINNRAITDERARTLLDQFEDKGCRVVIFLLPNQYGLPCVMCHVYDRNRRIQCHGSVAVRSDFNSAITSALHEAYMQYITYFVGTRDDYRSLAPTKQARIAYDNAQVLFEKDRGRYVQPESKIFSSVKEELSALIDQLTDIDIQNILVADMSPDKAYDVKSVKVLVPGMELWFCPDYTPSQYFDQRAKQTLQAIENMPTST